MDDLFYFTDLCIYWKTENLFLQMVSVNNEILIFKLKCGSWRDFRIYEKALTSNILF